MDLEPRFKKAFLKLGSKVGMNPFTRKEAEEILRREFANVREVLSELQRNGLLEVIPNIQDRRRKIYKLTRLTLHEQPTIQEITKDELLRLLKQGADIIRTRVDYKVLLLFLFYKAISDKYMLAYKQKYEEVKSDRRAKELANLDVIEMYDPQEDQLYTWHETVKDPQQFIGALLKLEEMNTDYLKGMRELISRTGLQSLFNNEENRRIVVQLIDLFGRLDFSEISYDILGDAYEWILSYFAPGKAKEGEVYTPIEVSRLMALIARPKSNRDRIIDPACGSGSMLIEFYRVAKEAGAEPMLYGQEANEVSAILARLNFILHGIQNVQIFTGDSLLNPHFPKGTITTANPPWNQDGYDEKTLKGSKAKPAYKYGYPTKQSADWAWIQLLTHFSEGISTVVIDTGALFRGGRERQIRKAFVDNDVIEAVILLPEKIFYNTQAPASIIVFNKQKRDDRKAKVLFINASKEFEQHPEVRKLNKLGEKHIRKIVEVYHNFEEQEGFSKVVPVDRIKQNDYNMNVSLYVAPIEEEDQIDLEDEYRKLQNLHHKYLENFSLVKDYLEEVSKLIANDS